MLNSCRRPYFERLLQHGDSVFILDYGCRRPYFERLLQHLLVNITIMFVVEGLILKGYYNTFSRVSFERSVVEGLILKGYYN